jgi:hypothetical protein
VLVSTDVDWRRVLRAFGSEDTHPSVLVLLPSFDAAIWSEALKLGAVDATAISVEHERLLWTVAAAYRRWERKQLVRAATSKNPLARAG